MMLWIQGLGLNVWATRRSWIRTFNFLFIIQWTSKAMITRCTWCNIGQQYHKDPKIFVKEKYEFTSLRNTFIHTHTQTNLHKVWEVFSPKNTDIPIVSVCDHCLSECFSTFDPWTPRDQHHTPKRTMSGAQEVYFHKCHIATYIQEASSGVLTSLEILGIHKSEKASLIPPWRERGKDEKGRQEGREEGRD